VSHVTHMNESCHTQKVWLETASSPDMAVDENSVDTPTEHVQICVRVRVCMYTYTHIPNQNYLISVHQHVRSG